MLFVVFYTVGFRFAHHVGARIIWALIVTARYSRVAGIPHWHPTPRALIASVCYSRVH